MAPPLLILRDIFLTLGDAPLLEGAELIVSAGERLCLVGRNGSGKSTLLRIASGLIEPDGGERFIDPGATLRYLAQEPDLSGFDTALAYAESGLAPGDDPYRAQYLLEQLGLSGTENPANLSGGEARRCALAQVLASEPDILFLDEPTNHLDLPAIEWLEGELGRSRSALVLISHDRRFLENLSRATIWLNGGTTHRLGQGFTHFETWRDGLLQAEGRARHELNRKIAVEMDWLHKGVTARRKRNQGRLRALHALRADRRKQHPIGDTVTFTTNEGKKSGRMVIEAKNIEKSFDGPTLVRDFSIRILRGDRIGIVGPNGAGKTTLLNMLTGVLAPDSGSVRTGTNLEIVTLDQNREALDPDETLIDALTGGGGDQVSVGGQTRHVIGYMKDFLFKPEQARTPVGVLSGGERGRLMLARALAKPSNLLILDEPTNDLDLETLDLLQEMIADYPGTVLLISHDRDFLDRVTTLIIGFEGNGQWITYAGGYSDMIAQRRDRIAPQEKDSANQTPKGASPKAAVKPKAAKKKLSFKDKHALKALPTRMERLQAEIATHAATLAESGLYARDAAAFEATATKLKTAEAALANAEDEWLALEMKREEIEGVGP